MVVITGLGASKSDISEIVVVKVRGTERLYGGGGQWKFVGRGESVGCCGFRSFIFVFADNRPLAGRR